MAANLSRCRHGRPGRMRGYILLGLLEEFGDLIDELAKLASQLLFLGNLFRLGNR